jgi:hypothetical protein
MTRRQREGGFFILNGQAVEKFSLIHADKPVAEGHW